MNPKQSAAPETPAANRLSAQLAWWFPAGTDAAEDLDRRLRTGRAFAADVHAAMQATARRLHETIATVDERIAGELAKIAASRQPVDLVAAEGEIGKALFEAAAAHAAAWNELWRAVCDCAGESADAPQSRPDAAAKAAKQPPAPTRRQAAESGAPRHGAA